MNPQGFEQFSSGAGYQQGVPDMGADLNLIKQQAAQEINTIQNMVKAGTMTSEQGYSLMNNIVQKAFEKYSTLQNGVQMPAPYAFENDEFFKQDGRLDVLDYLKNSGNTFDKDEILKISSLVENLENTAVDRYLRAQNHEKTLNSENETAKQRLHSNAQNAVSDGLNNLVFTREQIGKMSGAEFAKNERLIMEQLKKGLIH